MRIVSMRISAFGLVVLSFGILGETEVVEIIK